MFPSAPWKLWWVVGGGQEWEFSVEGDLRLAMADHEP